MKKNFTNNGISRIAIPRNMFKGIAVAVILVLSISLLLTGCGIKERFNDKKTQREIRREADSFDMQNAADELMGAIKNKDVEALKNMLSPRLIRETENIDEELEKLVDCFDGEFSKHGYRYLADINLKENHDVVVRKGAYTFFGMSTGEQWRVRFYYEVANTKAPDDSGICYIHVYLRSGKYVIVKRVGSMWDAVSSGA